MSRIDNYHIKNTPQASEDEAVDIVFILDMSGSMYDFVGDTIGGFNSTLESQKEEEGKALVTTVFFNDKIKRVNEREDIENIPLLTDKEYKPNSTTALLDAIGETIQYVEKAQREKPSKRTMVVITTDGLENASKEFNHSQIKELVESKQKVDGWEFVFLGADIDAIKTARSIGISADYAANYSKTPRGLRRKDGAVRFALSEMRRGRRLKRDWKKDLESEDDDQ